MIWKCLFATFVKLKLKKKLLIKFLHVYKLFTQLLNYTIIFNLMLFKEDFSVQNYFKPEKLSANSLPKTSYIEITQMLNTEKSLHKLWNLTFFIWLKIVNKKTISCNFSTNWFLYSYCTRRLSLKCKKLKTFKVDQKYSSQKTRNHLRRRNKMKMKNISKKWNIIFCGKHLLCRCLFVNNAWFYPRFLPWFNWFGIFGNRRYIYYPFNIVIYACFSRNKTVKSLPAYA